MQCYRHKKFDMRTAPREHEYPDLRIKEELMSLCRQEEDDTSSQCSSNYSLQQSKRRRLNSTVFEASAESESASSSQSLPNSISLEALRDICKYHGNMVRKFPKKERTPKDQERRNKNTIACRMSRRVKKLEHLAVEKQYKEFTSQYLKIVEQSMRANAYFYHLNQLVKVDQAKGLPPAPVLQKNFSIDYLINGIKQGHC